MPSFSSPPLHLFISSQSQHLLLSTSFTKHEWTTAKRAQRSDMKLPKGKKKKGWLVLKKHGDMTGGRDRTKDREDCSRYS
ncbi:unnamed protein product [Brugia timori]|uniref:Secreted protein n=1 Tax=Brugia timori TaxID=42155 RepID=A0A0R3RCA7_9BILA|nr:unnamed protein product [Brugia timori]